MNIYTLTRWHNILVYNCVFCPFDTMVEAAMAEHYEAMHAPKSPMPPGCNGLILVANKRGEEISPSPHSLSSVQALPPLPPGEGGEQTLPAKNEDDTVTPSFSMIKPAQSKRRRKRKE